MKPVNIMMVPNFSTNTNKVAKLFSEPIDNPKKISVSKKL